MNSANHFVFSIPLAWDAHDLAQKSYQLTSARHAKQIYLRTLAMYAVKYYLDCMGIEAAYNDGLSNPALLELSHAAELKLPGLGSLECLPVLPETATVDVSPEVWGDRLAYIAVQLAQSLQTATIVGYVETVAAAPIPLERFRQNSLEDLLIYLDRLRQTQIQKQTLQSLPINLSQWLQNEFQSGWQNLNALLMPEKLAYRNRHLSSVMGQKVLDLKQTDEAIELSLGLTPVDINEFNIWVGVYPTGDRTHLPVNLQLAILNQVGEAVMQVQAKTTENIQLEFSGEPGEQFSVRLTLGEVSVTEVFVI
jgi:hypothetical protein